MLSDITPEVSYSGNNSTVNAYVIPFYFVDNDHILVEVDGAAYSTFTVTGEGETAGSGELLTTTAIAGTSTVRIYRQTPRDQPYDYQDGQSYSAEVQEAALDRIEVQVQEARNDTDNIQTELDNRYLRAPEGDIIGDLPSEADRKNKALGFNDGGDPIALTINEGSVIMESTNTVRVSSGTLPDS